MAILTRDAILAAEDIKTELVNCPEWGGEIYIKTPSGAERDDLEAIISTRKGKKIVTNMHNIRAKFVAALAVDETKQRIFSDSDVVALGQKSAVPLDRCFTVALRLGGLTEAEIAEVAENLESGQSEESITG